MTRKIICATAAAAVAASTAFATHATAEPRPAHPPAPKTCPNKGGPVTQGSESTLIELQACRAVTRIGDDMKWRGYGSIRIGTQADPATRCEFLVYTGTLVNKKRSYRKQDTHNCSRALHKGHFFTYFDTDPDDEKFVTFTRVCAHLSNDDTTFFAKCVNSDDVLDA